MEQTDIGADKQTVKYKRYAFISYSHKDVKEAKWLHKHLEYYKLPNDIFNEYDETTRYLRPIFRDKEDIGTGVLKSELRKELEVSKYLIIICSPNSAQSLYVSQEAQVFIDLGRIDHIIPYIIDGVPNSKDEKECFPKSLINHIEKFPNDELLGANINEVGRQKAFIRVVSSLLSVEFDTLWKRHKREQKKRVFTLSLLFLFCILFAYWFALPIKLSVKLHDEFHHLPMPKDAMLIVNNTTYPLSTLDTIIQIDGIPGHMRLHDINIKFKSTYYKDIIDNITLGYGVNNFEDIKLKRDSTFAIYSGHVLDENRHPIESAVINIENKKTKTDSCGKFSITFSTIQQSTEKTVKINKHGYNVFIREEIPNYESVYYLFHEE